ncbi:MAG: hypothetical protein ACI857_003174 [Arenicella sp.]|jgi:hypothetical protein
MREAFLHYLFDQRKLGSSFITTNKEVLEVIEFGELNKNAGPDFISAKIKLNDTIWAGQIEFHLKSSDWIKHKHQFDKAYDNVIAHFVFEHDKEIKSGEYILPVVELKDAIHPNENEKYLKLIGSKNWIPCQSQVNSLDQDLLNNTIEQKFIERLIRKASLFNQTISESQGNEVKVLHQKLFRYFGGKVNAETFEKLASLFENNMLANLNFELDKISALLFGLSGLLPELSDEPYIEMLITEYEYQSKLFGLTKMNKQEWRFSSLRPPAHPVMRIAQMAAILSQQSSISSFLENPKKTFELLKLNVYWKTHYNFQNETKQKSYQIGEALQNSILINVIAPYFYAQFLRKGQVSNQLRAIELVRSLPPEKNRIISKWKEIGVKAENAAQSQGLIELKNEHCNEKKCLFCAIGKSILNK